LISIFGIFINISTTYKNIFKKTNKGTYIYECNFMTQ